MRTTLFIILMGLMSFACVRKMPGRTTTSVQYYGNPASPDYVRCSPPAKMHFTSGIICPVADSTAAEGTGKGTETRNENPVSRILKTLETTTLAKDGLAMKDVIYLRVYIAPDPFLNNQIDFKGWFEAYGAAFRTAKNPVKPARSTLGVASLVATNKTIEIELVAFTRD